MEFDIFLILIVIGCVIGFIRFIQLIYVSKKGFTTQLEYASYSHSSIEPDGPSASNAYMNGESTNHYVKAKYRTKNGLYLYKNVPQSIFGINSLDPIDIVVFPKNEKRYILKKRISQWILPIICTIVLLLIIVFFILNSI